MNSRLTDTDGDAAIPALDQLQRLASTIRARTIETSSRSGTPHLGSCLSCIDILVALYFYILKIDPANPNDPGRDRLILSKGHGAPALFQVLAERGYFPVSDLDDYGADGGIFAEHPPTPSHLPGIEAATGSLGHGLSLGLGMAYAARVTGHDYRVFAVLSDGECNEGSVWEAAMLAGAQRLGRVAVVIDFNKWQATGRSEEVMAVNPLADKWRAFGWETHEIDGHNINSIIALLEPKREAAGKPLAIVAHTIKGKGVSFMEDDNNWHYRIPTSEEVEQAKVQLGVAV